MTDEDEREELIGGALTPGEYTPMWTMDIGEGCSVGVTIDDGCLMVLTRDEWGYWNATTHIPERWPNSSRR